MSPEPYLHPAEALADELRRVDHLVRAQVIRWRALIADDRDPESWGMILVSHQEVDGYLSTPFTWPPPLPSTALDLVEQHLSAESEAAVRIADRLSVTPPDVSRVRSLAALFHLRSIEVDILLLAALAEMDSRYRRMYGYLMDDASRTRPSAGLLSEMVAYRASTPDAVRSAYAGPLVRNQLLRVIGHADGAEGLAERPVRIDDRILDYLMGQESPDALLKKIVKVLAPHDHRSEDPTRDYRSLVQWLVEVNAAAVSPLLYLYGADADAKQVGAALMLEELAQVDSALSATLLAVDVPALLRAGSAPDELIELVKREAMLMGAALFWSGCDAFFDAGGDERLWDAVLATTAKTRLPTFVDRTPLWEPVRLPDDVDYVRVSFEIPPAEQRKSTWINALSAGTEDLEPAIAESLGRELLADELAHRYLLTKAQVDDAMATARAIARTDVESGGPVGRNHILDAARRQSAARAVSFAHRVPPDPDRALDELILPEDTHRQLEDLHLRAKFADQVFELVNQAHLRPGLVALFAGSSGTGKTMAAEVLASMLHVDLYRVDLSQVVSKWVGETEKHLERIFADAEGTNSVLFFDEADALFGKRGEVKEAHDRWANLEVSFLLQRIERYPGLVVLATNLAQNIDEAFRRRVQVTIEFPFPEPRLRRKLYDRMLVSDRLVGPDEPWLELIADAFEFSGGTIRNVVIDAVHRAFAMLNANRGPGEQLDDQAGLDDRDGRMEITEEHVVAAVCRQLQKEGRPLTPADFPGPLSEIRDRTTSIVSAL